MNHTFAVHVVEDIEHLGEEVSTSLLAHSSQSLADVEEETAGDVLEENVDQVLNFSSGWLFDVAV